jgi:hypothetical protein
MHPPQQSLSTKPVIQLDSVGGRIDEAMKIGRLLRANDLTVAVPQDSSCISVCVLILVGGVIRIPRGRVGIHRLYFDELDPDLATGDVDRAYKAMFEDIRKYLAEMNIPTRLADEMEVVPPEEVRYLNEDEQAAFLLNQVDPAFNEKLTADISRMYGISMGLYRQRESLANAKCQFPGDDATLGALVANDTCRESILLGLSEEEYTRREAIKDSESKRLKQNGASINKLRACFTAIMAAGKESCD